MTRSAILRIIAVTGDVSVLLVGPVRGVYAQVVCSVAGQQGRSFIGGGTVPFTVQSTKDLWQAIGRND